MWGEGGERVVSVLLQRFGFNIEFHNTFTECVVKFPDVSSKKCVC